MKKIIVAIFCCVCGYANAAGSYTGNELLAHMRSANANERTYALFYVLGVVDSEEIAKIGEVDKIYSRQYFCAPDNGTAQQFSDVVKKTLEDTPSIRAYDAALLVKGALLNAWPCSKNPPRKN